MISVKRVTAFLVKKVGVDIDRYVLPHWWTASGRLLQWNSPKSGSRDHTSLSIESDYSRVVHAAFPETGIYVSRHLNHGGRWLGPSRIPTYLPT